jgi:ubiquitin C-terminal hydrolase
MVIPLKFELPKDLMADSEFSVSINYELVGCIVHSGNFAGGHYIAYIKTPDGFLGFDDSVVRPIGDEELSTRLATQAYVMTYKRIK